MNINQSALKLYLDGLLPQELTKYFTKDYAQIVSKVEMFKKKNNQTPSLDFLIQYASKLGEDKEQSNRIEDILYVVSKIKDIGMSVDEISELFLSEYKSNMIRDLIKKSSTAIIEENMILVEKLSKEIADISSLSLGGNNFLEDDDKTQFSKEAKKLNKISSGLLQGEGLPIEKTVLGSNIIYGAASGLGKTILGLTTALNCFLQGQNVLLISYEISKAQIIIRMRSLLTGVSLDEVSNNSYLTEDAKVLVLCSGYVMTKDITLNKAVEAYKKFGEDYLKELPDRTNSLKILAAIDLEDLEEAKAKGKTLDSLPNDEEILEILEMHGEKLDSVIIDYISEVPFKNSYNSREISITEFTRKLKLLALEKGFNNYLLSQVVSENEVYGMFQTKYALSLINVADTALFMVSTKEMKKMGLVAICTRKARHFQTGQCWICQIDYTTGQLTYTGESCTLAEIQEELKKDFRQNEKK